MKIINNLLESIFFVLLLCCIILTCWYFSIGNIFVRYSLRYYPDQSFIKSVDKYRNPDAKVLFEYDYGVYNANSPRATEEEHSGIMTGFLVKGWQYDTTWIAGAGSGNGNVSNWLVPFHDYCKTIISKPILRDDEQPSCDSIFVQTLDGTRYQLSVGAELKLQMPNDGIYKKLSQKTTRFGEDPIIPVLAYSALKNNTKQDKAINHAKWQKMADDMSMDDFIKKYVEKEDGFVVYYRSQEFRKFFSYF